MRELASALEWTEHPMPAVPHAEGEFKASHDEGQVDDLQMPGGDLQREATAERQECAARFAARKVRRAEGYHRQRGQRLEFLNVSWAKERRQMAAKAPR